MPIIWTDEDNEVYRIHHRPGDLEDHEKYGAIGVESVPDPDTPDGEIPVLYYSDSAGFRYEYIKKSIV